MSLSVGTLSLWVLLGNGPCMGRRSRAGLSDRPRDVLTALELPRVLPMELCTGVPGAAPSMQGGCAILEGQILLCRAGSSIALGCLCPPWATALAGARDGLPREERGAFKHSTWLPTLCILSPLIMSLFHLRCEKSWGAAACSHRHLLGERVGSGADAARAGGRVLG